MERYRAAGAVLTIIVVSIAGCALGEANNPPSSPPIPEVTTAEVLVEDLQDWAEFTGRLAAVERVEVRPRVSGYVEAVHFREGGRIEKGDLLFQIDPRPFKAEVNRLAAQRERARTEVDVARSYAARAERLLAKNAISQEEHERLTADAAAAEAELAAVEAALDAAELNLEFTRVVAPITGRVSNAVVTAGNLVDPSTLLTTVVSDDPIYAYFDADEQSYLRYVADSAVGEERAAVVYAGLIDEEGYPHTGRLDFVDNRVDPQNGTIRVRAVLDNRDGQFTPGLFVRLKLVSNDRYRAALIDDRAIGTDLGRKFVLTVDEQNVAQYRSIEAGRAIDGLRVVTAGLQAGDVVIINGLQRVRPGTPVAPTRVELDPENYPALARVLARQDAQLAALSAR